MGEEAKQGQIQTEEAKPEQKTKEKEEEKPAEEKVEEPKPPSPFVLFVDLHCVGCAKKIENSIMKIRGVEGVVVDMAQNQVTIKGIVEPQAVCNRIIKKTKRRAKVLSPLPESEGQQMPQIVTSQVTGSITVELNVNMHCEACAEQLKRKILKMRGVQTAITELNTGKVTVTGTMDANKLVEYIYRRTKKQARIVPQPEPAGNQEEKNGGGDRDDQKAAPANEEAKPTGDDEKKEEPEAKSASEEAADNCKPKKQEEEAAAAVAGDQNNNNNSKDAAAGEGSEKEGCAGAKKEGGEGESGGGVMTANAINIIDEESMTRLMYYYQQQQHHQHQPQLYYWIERIPPPQLFSDENPNACSIS